MHARDFIRIMTRHFFKGPMSLRPGHLDRLQAKDRAFRFEAARQFQAMKDPAAPAVNNEERPARNACIHFDQ